MIMLEDLRKDVTAIGKAVKKLSSTGIREEALLHMIQRACPGTKKPSMKTIRTVIEGMEGLEDYVYGDEE